MCPWDNPLTTSQCRYLNVIAFRMLLLFTGHGYFAEYLNQIGRESAAQCQTCARVRDSAQYTVGETPEWALVSRIGRNLSHEP